MNENKREKSQSTLKGKQAHGLSASTWPKWASITNFLNIYCSRRECRQTTCIYLCYFCFYFELVVVVCLSFKIEMKTDNAIREKPHNTHSKRDQISSIAATFATVCFMSFIIHWQATSNLLFLNNLTPTSYKRDNFLV